MFELLNAGLLPERIELVDGRLLAAGETEYVLAPAEDVSAGEVLGAPVRAAVEAVRLKLRERLGKCAAIAGQHPMPATPAWPSPGSMDSVAPIGSYPTPNCTRGAPADRLRRMA